MAVREAALANVAPTDGKAEDDPANAGLRREPGLERYKDIAPEPMKPAANEFDPDMDERDDDAVRARALARNARNVARQISMDPGDSMEL
jgi:type IV secretion system protein VirD4